MESEQVSRRLAPAPAPPIGSTGMGHPAGYSPAHRYDVFLSYRRKGGSDLARLLFKELTDRGFRVFLDAETLGAGEWDRQLENRIDECPDFVAIITDGYFDRCGDVEDVVRKEIARALVSGKNVIPLLASAVPFPAALPDEIASLSSHNGVKYVHEYSAEAVEKLCGQLVSTPLLGPERLLSPELQPKVVVGLVCGFVGGYTGFLEAGFADGLTHAPPFFSLGSLLRGFVMGLFSGMVFGIPIIVVLAATSHILHIRRDQVYGGPWLPYWCVVWPTAAAAGALVANSVFCVLGGQSEFVGGIAGGCAGVAVAALFTYTQAWLVVSTMLKGKVR